MRVTAADGTELDADFELEGRSYGADLVLHSRSGSKTKNARNPDYFDALEEILRRIGTLGATISSVHIDSSVALQLPAAARRLQLDYPLRPADTPDIAALRREITRAQRTVARTGTSLGTGGNNHKRIRIAVDLTQNSVTIGNLVAALQGRGALPVRQYVPAKEDATVAPADFFTTDAALVERGLAAHASTQNSLAQVLKTRGRQPFSPGLGEPDFDLAWQEPHRFGVVEVKSLTGLNETQQLRLGLGQVLDYRETLAHKHPRVQAVLAVEREPPSRWLGIAASVNVLLSWAPDWTAITDFLNESPTA